MRSLANSPDESDELLDGRGVLGRFGQKLGLQAVGVAVNRDPVRPALEHLEHRVLEEFEPTDVEDLFPAGVQLTAVLRPDEPVNAVLEGEAALLPGRGQAARDRVHLQDLGVEPEPPQVDAGAQAGDPSADNEDLVTFHSRLLSPAGICVHAFRLILFSATCGSGGRLALVAWSRWFGSLARLRS